MIVWLGQRAHSKARGWPTVDPDDRLRRMLFTDRVTVALMIGAAATGRSAAANSSADTARSREIAKSGPEVQMMDALGKLCSGMPLDFNNILYAVMGNADLPGIEAKAPASLSCCFFQPLRLA